MTWLAAHADRPEHADLADPLDDAHGQRVDDAERGDEHGDEGERVEHAEDAGRAPRRPSPGSARSGSIRGRTSGPSRGSPARASVSRPGTKRTAKASAPSTPSDAVASGQPTRIASPPEPGMDRSTIAATSRSIVWLASTGTVMTSPRCRPSRSASATGMITAPPSSSASSAADAVAGHGREPVVDEEVAPDDGGRIDAHAAVGDVERGDRRDAGHAGHARERLADRLVRTDGADRGDDLVARNDVLQPLEGRGAGGLRRPAERDDHRQADHERPEGQRRPVPVAGERAAREALLDAQHERDREAEEAGQRLHEERRDEGRVEQDDVDRHRSSGALVREDRRPGEHRHRRDREEDERDPGEAAAAQARQVVVEPGAPRRARSAPPRGPARSPPGP